jgi:hypothetical protein
LYIQITNHYKKGESVNKVYDMLKQTLTNIKLSDINPGTAPLPEEDKPAAGASASPLSTDSMAAVPKGRTTLRLSRKGGTITPTAPVPAATANPVTLAPALPEPPDRRAAAHDADDFDGEDYAIAGRPASPALPEPDMAADLPEIFPEEIDPLPVIDEHPTAPMDEATAVLRVRATLPKIPKPKPAPDDMVPMNFRLPQYLKDAFDKTCRDQGRTPSIVLRNLMKQFCRLCLVLALAGAVLSPTAATAQTKDTSYTTDQIMTYLQSKAFSGLGKNVPGAKGSIGARHSLWQTGASDPINDFVYSDYSNTRLEAKIEIPIFDLSYLRNRDKEKIEHRAFVMKALSRILAAQKAVKVTESQIYTMNQRREYMNTQVNLKLANRSDLFSIEDKLFSLQSQLFEAQSTLEQRVIELAVLAENDWQEAYRMIIKWDGVLFAPVKGNKK